MFKVSVLSLALGALIAVLILALAGYLTVANGVINPGADEPIPQWERWIAKTSLRAYLKRETPNVQNPLPVTDENLKHGIDLYRQNCAVCHGDETGKKTSITNGLYKKPNIFADEDWSQDKDGLIYWFIKHGVRLTGMPAYSNSLKDEDIWSLVLLIKQMKSLPPSVQEYWLHGKKP